jgi:hypothetical protein
MARILTAIWYTYFMVIWYSFSRFGLLHKEKSGNPGIKLEKHAN